MSTPNEQFQEFFNINAEQDNIALSKAPGGMWMGKGQENALKTFHTAAETVPAYQDFLKKHKIDHSKIKTFEDFIKVPETDKESYLAKYPLDQLCIAGDVSKTNLISASSGSTGQPFYWPRNLEQDVNVAKILELMYRRNFTIEKKNTLIVVSFGLGVWTAGVYMLTASRFVAAKDYPLTIMSPGIDLEETIKVLKNVAHYYEQVILVGFPGFVKDVIDCLVSDKVDISKMNLKVFTAGEVYTEEWRDYLITRAGMTNEYKDITSVLASSEGGLIGIETPLSVYIRRKSHSDKKIQKHFFGDDNLPSIVQYNPIARFYEAVNQDLILTSPGALPLIRFNTKDRGGIMSFDQIREHLVSLGISMDGVVTDIGDEPWSLPFVYVFGRSNLTVTIYGVNVYPESIKAFLLLPQFHDKLTGRFSMQSNVDDAQNQYLEFFIELSPKLKESDVQADELSTAITGHLQTVNSEFRKLSNSINRPLVRVQPRQFQDKRYFSSNKQKFVITTPHA